jgi:acetolactate synthase-1/3 small subunit
MGVTDLGTQQIEREMVLVHVKATGVVRQQVIHLVEIFRARVIGVSESVLTIEVTGEPSKVNAMLRLLNVFGMQEMVRTGTITIGKVSTTSQ